MDTDNIVNKERVLLHGIYLFFTLLSLVIYVSTVKKPRANETEFTDFNDLLRNVWETTDIDHEAITNVTINVEDNVEAEEIVETLLNIKNHLEFVVRDRSDGAEGHIHIHSMYGAGRRRKQPSTTE